MDDFRVGSLPTPPPDGGFGPEDPARTTGGAPTRRTEMSGGLANAATTDHVGGNDPTGPNLGVWLDAPGPGQYVDMTALMLTLHQAGVALRTAMHEAQQVAETVVDKVKAEAENQGLTPQNLADKVKAVAQEATDTAKEEVKKQVPALADTGAQGQQGQQPQGQQAGQGQQAAPQPAPSQPELANKR